MSTTTRPNWSALLPGLLVAAALVELLLLRTATRTLIHIPGLGRFEAPIRVIAEVGRFAYYLAAVSLVTVLVIRTFRELQSGSPRRVVIGAGLALFLGTAAAGRFGVFPLPLVGIVSLAALILVVASIGRGRRAVPVLFFVLATVAAGTTVLELGLPGDLTGRQVDGLLLTAEIGLILSAVTAPILLTDRPDRRAVWVGLGVAAITTGAFAADPSTVSILVLWNLGVPGWLPGLTYAVAAGSLAATLWSALVSGRRSTAAGLLLLAAGGIGMISTYQTGLVLAGLLFLSDGIAEHRVSATTRQPGFVIDRGRSQLPVGPPSSPQPSVIG
jgi:hypothetical protein